MNRKIFISYSSKDKEFAMNLVDYLKANGVNVWFDHFEIKVGDSIIDKISNAIDNMRGIAIVLSGYSIRSNWVRKELNTTLINRLSGNNILIYPILLSNCKIPTLLSEYKYADFRKSFNEGASQLLLALAENRTLIDTPPKADAESTLTRLSRISSQCFEAYETLLRELILLAETILETWVEISKGKDGRVEIGKPTEDEEQFADLIIDKLIADSRSEHERIDFLRSTELALELGLRDEIVASILHFDKKLFVSGNEQWTLYGRPRPLYSQNSIFTDIFDNIIPTQFIAAIARFTLKWTNDSLSRSQLKVV